MRTSRVTAAGTAVAAALAGCAVGAPRLVDGTPAPLSASPSGTAAATGSPVPAATRPSGSPTAAGVPALPAGYRSFVLTAYGATVRLDVPTEWTERTDDRTGDEPAVVRNFGDATETLLVKVEISPRAGRRDAREGLAAYEPVVPVKNYRRLSIVDVPGVGDSAVDWTFTFTSATDGRLRRVADRLVVSGDASVAVYFSALSQDYSRLLPIWQRGVGTLEISGG